MKVVQLVEPTVLRLVDVPKPTPGPGEVLLKVTAAGVCHTDVSIRHDTHGLYPRGLILGHEIAGTVAAVGDGTGVWKEGDAAIVYPCWSCGVCKECVAGRQNACRATGDRMSSPPTPGVTVSGGMAEYVAVPAAALVRAEGLDPAIASVLPDAALVPYHSLRAVSEQLRPGTTALVIGLGGLGHLAVQMLRSLTAARVIAIDTNEAALAAIEASVDLSMRANDADVQQRILAFTDGQGVDVVLDFVGIDATLKLAGAVVARYGAIRVPGLGGGTLAFEASHASTTLPWGASITRPYSGTYNDLVELVALARVGGIKPSVSRYPFAQAIQALDDLEAGKIRGRAVLVMDA